VAGALDLADGLRMMQEAGEGGYFGHEAHLRFAWEVLDEAEDLADAERITCLTIRNAAGIGGNPDKYHATVTIFWVRLLHHLREAHADVTSVEQMLDVYPDLGDQTLPERHWSNLDSAESRSAWVEPDLIPLP
jgi:hypothetical protein